MNPSSSSNADASSDATFRVASRGLNADLSRASLDESSCDLGTVATGQLVGLLTTYLALDAAAIAEADAHLVVSGRRGRFVLRARGANFILQPVGDPSAAYITLPLHDVPSWLDQSEGTAVTPADAEHPTTAPAPAPPRRTGPAAAFATVSLVILALSAWFTFSPSDIDPADDYGPVTDSATLGTLRQKTPGTYAAGDDQGERILEVRADGIVIYREPGPGYSAEDDRTGPSSLAIHLATKTPVLRVEGLGTVFIRDAQHLDFAQETYTRRPAK